MSKFFTYALVAFLSLSVFGCGKQADTTKPIDQIQKEVQTMSTADLEKNARAYYDAMMDQKGELDKVKEKIKELSPQDLLGEKAKDLKTEISGISSEVDALNKRFEIYADALKKQGGDLSKITG